MSVSNNTIRSLVQVAIKGALTLTDLRKLVEREYMTQVLESVDNNQSQAARLLGIHRNTWTYKVKNLNILIRDKARFGQEHNSRVTNYSAPKDLKKDTILI